MSPHWIPTHSRVSEHTSTAAPKHRRSSARYHMPSSLRKRTPFGRSNNCRVVDSFHRRKQSRRVPVNGGEVEGWQTIPSSRISKPTTSRSSRRGREQTRLNRREADQISKPIQRVWRTSESPWKGVQGQGPRTFAHPQPYNIGKRLNPATLFYNCGGDDLCPTDD